MSWLSDKWMRNRGPIEAGNDPTSDGPFSDNQGEEITPRTMRNFAYELQAVFDSWTALTAGLISVGNVDEGDVASAVTYPVDVWVAANPGAPPLPVGTDLVIDFVFPQATGWVVGDPLTEVAPDGTMLVDETTGEIYERENGAWVLTTLVLPAGPPGPSSHPLLTDRDTADSHPASAISLLDVGGLFASDDLEGAMAETVTSIDVRRITKMTQAQYTALPVKDPETLYMLTP
jgi:hypothetical protein